MNEIKTSEGRFTLVSLLLGIGLIVIGLFFQSAQYAPTALVWIGAMLVAIPLVGYQIARMNVKSSEAKRKASMPVFLTNMQPAELAAWMKKIEDDKLTPVK
jgi:hypothetical protein